MIDVQYVDNQMYYVWLDQRLLDAMGRNVPEEVIKSVLTSAFSMMYSRILMGLDDDVPF